MMITMLATLCHLATVTTAIPGIPGQHDEEIEFCKEEVIASEDLEPTRENIAGCYTAAQMTVALHLPPGYTVHEIRCASDKDGKDRPKDAI